MDYLKISHKPTKQVIAQKALLADGFFDRLIGLMFKKQMIGFDALLIIGSNSIHTCFMRFNIDVVFLSRDNKVVKIFKDMKPWRFTLLYLKAMKVIELPGGSLGSIQVGDEVEIVNV
ncbi:MAG: DUF192 domain-containing protein [Bacteriovoracaceae bacterium]